MIDREKVIPPPPPQPATNFFQPGPVQANPAAPAVQASPLPQAQQTASPGAQTGAQTANPAGQAAGQQGAPAVGTPQNAPQTNPFAAPIQKKDPPIDMKSIPTGPISREAFAYFVQHRYGVKAVVKGTQKMQEDRLSSRARKPVQIPTWQDWDPGSTSEDYSSIIKAIEDFNDKMGGIPALDTITFFQMEYDVSPTGAAVPNKDAGASFGGGSLTIFEKFNGSPSIPIGRSVASGSYPNAPVATLGGPGFSPGAPVPYTNKQESIKTNIGHELGHGLAEAAMGVDHDTFKVFKLIAGWTNDSPAALFDVQAPSVKGVFAGGGANGPLKAQLPPQMEITADNWNAPSWLEQPISAYAVQGGPGEDFAECVAAFIYHPDVLEKRSPARYQFFKTNLQKWQPQLQKLAPFPPPPGDYPSPKKDGTAIA